MNSTEQINALVLKYGLSETVKQEIVKLMNNQYANAYSQGYSDGLKDVLNK